MRFTLYLANGTAKATFFMFCQRQTCEMKASRRLGIWIPKSNFTVVSRAPDKAWTWPECEVEVKGWFALQENMATRQAHIREHHVKQKTP